MSFKNTHVYITLCIYVMLTSTTNATEHGTHRGIKFADFGVYNAWQFSMYNVRRDFIFETKTHMHALY